MAWTIYCPGRVAARGHGETQGAVAASIIKIARIFLLYAGRTRTLRGQLLVASRLGQQVVRATLPISKSLTKFLFYILMNAMD
ncbi:MAG: hypothetical protein JRI22_13525 [Deltaproteobacteria bacterium]|nr:hypothetical protein [Deltaproteobacteria bacterium]